MKEEKESNIKKAEGRGPHLRKPSAIGWLSTSKEVVISLRDAGYRGVGHFAPPQCIQFYQIRVSQALTAYDKPLQERRSAP